MTPVTCRVSHKPPEQYGDCLRACIASIMDRDAETVPNFADGGVDAITAWQLVRSWLAPQGLSVFITNYPPEPLDDLLAMMQESNPDCHYILFGNTAEGMAHCVVGKGGKIVHNPAWVGCSIVGPLSEGAWSVWVIARV